MTVLDIIQVTVLIIVFAIGTFIGYILINEVSENEQIGDQDAIIKAKASILGFDPLIAYLMVGLFMATLIGAFYIQTHPVFFVMSLWGLLIVVILVPMLANVYIGFAQDPLISETANLYPLTNLIFEHYPFIAIVFAFILIIVLYAKVRSGGSQYG